MKFARFRNTKHSIWYKKTSYWYQYDKTKSFVFTVFISHFGAEHENRMYIGRNSGIFSLFLPYFSKSLFPAVFTRLERFLLIRGIRHTHVRIFPCDIKSTLENLNAYVYEIPRNRAEISFYTLTKFPVTVQK